MADVYVNALMQISTEPTTTDSVVCVNRNTNEGKIIDYNLLADVILAKLSSKTYSSLTTSSKLLPGAINELDSDIASLNSSLATQIITATAGTGITINWQRCRRINNIAILELDITTASAINASSDMITDIPVIGGNSIFFFAPTESKANRQYYELAIQSGKIISRTAIPSDERLRFMLTYFIS